VEDKNFIPQLTRTLSHCQWYDKNYFVDFFRKFIINESKAMIIEEIDICRAQFIDLLVSFVDPVSGCPWLSVPPVLGFTLVNEPGLSDPSATTHSTRSITISLICFPRNHSSFISDSYFHPSLGSNREMVTSLTANLTSILTDGISFSLGTRTVNFS
jgi:hypothetical protein